jgi:hypothetical protein
MVKKKPARFEHKGRKPDNSSQYTIKLQSISISLRYSSGSGGGSEGPKKNFMKSKSCVF